MPAKKKIEQNRTRYRTLAFRLSDDELRELNQRIKLSGRQKQEYILRSLLHQEIVVIGNAVLFDKMNDSLNAILAELKHLDFGTDMDKDLLLPIRTTVEILEKFKVEKSAE